MSSEFQLKIGTKYIADQLLVLKMLDHFNLV